MVLPRPQRRRNSILLTSLVDVLFVLLFFFMLTSSVLDFRSVTVGVPRAAGGAAVDAAAADAGAAALDLLPGRRVRLGGEEFALEALAEGLARHGVHDVTVRALPGVPVQDLVDVIETLRRAAIGLKLARSGA